ncbi:hypothetical protein [Kineococcus endophyticus]
MRSRLDDRHLIDPAGSPEEAAVTVLGRLLRGDLVRAVEPAPPEGPVTTRPASATTPPLTPEH